MKCTRCVQLVTAELANSAAFRWLAPTGEYAYLCTPHLDGWLDQADDDETLEPAEVAFLVVTADNTTVEDELALVIGSSLLSGFSPLGVARMLLQSGWAPPPVPGIEGMALLRG